MPSKLSALGLDPPCQPLAEFFSFLEQTGGAAKVVALIGDGTLRDSVVGFDDLVAIEYELTKMDRLSERGMVHGASDISNELIIPPSCFTPASMVISLAMAQHRHGGFLSAISA